MKKCIVMAIVLFVSMVNALPIFAMEMEKKGKRKAPEITEEEPNKKQAVADQKMFSTANIVIVNNTHRELEIYPLLDSNDKDYFNDLERIIVLKPGMKVTYIYMMASGMCVFANPPAIRYDGKIIVKEKNSERSTPIYFYKDLLMKENKLGESFAQYLANAKNLVYKANIGTSSRIVREESLAKAFQYFNIIVDIRGNATNDFEGSSIFASINPQKI